MTEKQLMDSLRHAARELGWLEYHTWSSLHSSRGFPDLCMVRGRRIVFAELKNDTGKVTEEQAEWIEALRLLGAPVEVYLWRPKDLEAAYATLQRRPT